MIILYIKSRCQRFFPVIRVFLYDLYALGKVFMFSLYRAFRCVKRKLPVWFTFSSYFPARRCFYLIFINFFQTFIVDIIFYCCYNFKRLLLRISGFYNYFRRRKTMSTEPQLQDCNMGTMPDNKLLIQKALPLPGTLCLQSNG